MPVLHYVCRTEETLQYHRRGSHQKEEPSLSCQRFFVTGKASHFFEVTPRVQAQRSQELFQIGEADFVQAQVYRQLQGSQGQVEDDEAIIPTTKDTTECSPWLELTRRPECVGGYRFDEVAPLGSLPDLSQEPLLVIVEGSIERLIDCQN
ncbi:uncharacterized protein N7458_004309 [Penicillium daleae]|uniref:Uncharacterized protein n=1 Tax=Penicillium daleae TaxID=63821 RepID=A0AAD6C9Y3_9EURO|nr:uncharacterized protein N7458_004309 [Penicillium daleae]KAJ5456045.1 hypothetical protein N7458_004309 [Penicillium daleae]